MAPALARRRFLQALGGLIPLGIASGSAKRSLADGEEVDVALTLAIDCSYSVDEREFRLQMDGIGLALQRVDVRHAIKAGDIGRIALSAYEWSSATNRQVVVPWTILSGGQETIELGETIRRVPRVLAQGGTSISNALLFGQALFSQAPPATRRVIDVSSDGRNNTGISVRQVRDEVVAAGITINGLVIRNEWPTLDVYFREEVVGGPGHFVMPAETYDEYAEAIARKMLREITGPGMT